MNLGLADKVALVTGASKGIGKAISLSFAEHGARVCLLSRSEAALVSAIEEIRPIARHEPIYFVGDVADPQCAQSAVQHLQTVHSRIDILVNNAGGPPTGSFLNHSEESWNSALQQNLLSVIRFSRSVAPLMIEQKYGRILNITSTLAKEPSAAMVLSATARAGVSAFAKSISAELAPHGITVNTLAPGGVTTDRLMSLLEKQSQAEEIPFEAAMSRAVASVPLGRMATPSEFASVAVFLASEAASYVTGANIMVDGGLTRSIF
jgi:3-oxoacyl-[acyl-carrier protein] reductase